MRFIVVIVLFVTSLLTSCMVAVVAGAAAGVVVYDRRSVASIESDARIFHVISRKIANDRRFLGSRISIVSFNQVVLLVGQTPTASLRVVAEQYAQNTPTVRRVYDEVSIEPSLSISRQTQDTWITGQIRSQMLGRKGLESGSIRVVTENSVVYLMGIATHEQANLAVNVARQVAGVQKVVKVFQYIA